MKILTISAHFPPHHSGGYGIRVKDIMDGLAERGHEILVLTTKAKRPVRAREVNSNYPIERVLRNHSGIKRFLKELYFDVLDVGLMRRYINDFKPDLIYLGHIYPISKQLMPLLASMPIRILFDEGGNGLKGAWTDHGRWFRLLSDYKFKSKVINFFLPTIRRIILWVNNGKLIDKWSWPDNLSVIFNSKQNQSFVLGLEVPMLRSEVIYSGINTDRFTFRPRKGLSTPIRIICPGRIEPRKGQMDAVRLIAALRNEGIVAEMVLVGKVVSNEYERRKLKEIEELGLRGQIQTLSMASQDELVRLYHQADICFFPSYQESGLSRVPLEAMTCGCVVISYGNEGSDEIIKNGENGYLVSPGDIKNVKEVIDALKKSPVLVQETCSRAHKDVIESYSMPRYIDKVESFLTL